jgi:uncharacterized SAM-binding protein YcdF (DUF218 family)
MATGWRGAKGMFMAIAVLLILIALEALYFRVIMTAEDRLEPADVIVVFDGSEERCERGYALANSRYAPFLIVSPASVARLRRLAEKYHLVDGIVHLPEPHARSTFENALYTKRILEAQQLTSVILVTSSNHMPRAYLLLRLLTVGSRTRIQMSRVEPAGQPFPAGGAFPGFQKGVLQEMVKVWGSLAQLCLSAVRGFPE